MRIGVILDFANLALAAVWNNLRRGAVPELPNEASYPEPRSSLGDNTEGVCLWWRACDLNGVEHDLHVASGKDRIVACRG